MKDKAQLAKLKSQIRDIESDMDTLHRKKDALVSMARRSKGGLLVWSRTRRCSARYRVDQPRASASSGSLSASTRGSGIPGG